MRKRLMGGDICAGSHMTCPVGINVADTRKKTDAQRMSDAIIDVPQLQPGVQGLSRPHQWQLEAHDLIP